MFITCLDLEGVLVPEIWIAFAEASGIPELKRTTRDEPDYDKLMKWRLGILKEHGAVNALMSGSGPTVFGIFTDDQNAKEAYEAMQEAGLARQLFLTGFADGRGREE